MSQVVDRELALAGYPSSETSAGNLTIITGVIEGEGGLGVHSNGTSAATVALTCDRSCYAILVGATVTFTAGVYQVRYSSVSIFFRPRTIFCHLFSFFRNHLPAKEI